MASFFKIVIEVELILQCCISFRVQQSESVIHTLISIFFF